MHKLLSKMENVLTSLAIGSILVMVLLTTVDAASRYLFNLPIKGAYEMTEKYFMVIAVFFALSYGYHCGCNIRVTFLLSHFSQRVRLVLKYIVQILSIVYGILLVISTFTYALRCFHDKLDNVYDIPLGPAFMVPFVGVLLMTLWLLYDLGQVKNGESGLFIEEEAPTSAT